MPNIRIEPNSPLISDYYAALDKLKVGQGIQNEGGTRRPFEVLLEGVGSQRNWTMIAELGTSSSRTSKTIYPDGTLRDEWKLPHAYWEAKDSHDDLDDEIRKKIAKGYPTDNIIFEDTERAVLYQDGQEELAIDLRDRELLARMLTRFVNHEIEPFEDFEKAITSYSDEIRNIATTLKEKIESAHKNNNAFKDQFEQFMEVCRKSLNPNISQAAVDEMLIQHLMTERIIRRVFHVESFNRTNVIANEIEKVIDALTSRYFDRREFLGALDRFYLAIEDAANQVREWQDKQAFINTVYERFFQGYSVKVADTHGIVYTPQEIVDFMCAAVEEVLEDEFGKHLGDDDVYVIDPATGTGNFIINLLERAHKRNLRGFEAFYRERLFANEVMLMPYYIASLNIEHTYYELMGTPQPFEGICFVDTLDLAESRQKDMFMMTEKNTERVQRQKDTPITVIIGNPPYNTAQTNENDNNKNRAYEIVDARVRGTYGKDSTATLNRALYDPYVKFFRWATDRLGERDGVVCMVTNNSFIDGISFDGMRKHLLQDFHRVYHLDLGGNVRKNQPGKTISNVFDIMVGVGITIAIRNERYTSHRLLYHRVEDTLKKDEKLDFLAQHVEEDGKHNALNTITWQTLRPNSKHTWLIADNEAEFEALIPMGTKGAKAGKAGAEDTIFGTFSLGVATNRDEWVYAFTDSSLSTKMDKFINNYNFERMRLSSHILKRANLDEHINNDRDFIKWTDRLKSALSANEAIQFEPKCIRRSMYRPFTRKSLYFDNLLNQRRYLQHYFFPTAQSEQDNRVILIGGYGRKDFAASFSNVIPDLNFYADPAQTFPFYVYDEDGENRYENISDWALAQFRQHYQDDRISKWDIFYYVYGLLHHPEYRERYADVLKRDLPRIPFVPSDVAFRVASDAGQQLAELHLNYESVERYPLAWETTEGVSTSFRVQKMRPQRKRDAQDGTYKVYDSLKYNDTLTLTGIPEEAFAYRLGNRSALDWVVEQYQVKTDTRSGITSDPNGYSDDEQYIVQLVERVITVSLRTVELVETLADIPINA